MNNIIKTEMADFVERSYLNYSMYVILDRSLPHVADGLKPVHRRIIYAMNELGLDFKAKHKKSARTVGDVLGKYHPHGDTACYEAMVLMAQPFSYRYPIIDGQGNWGSPDDPKSFAAMRYTESKLQNYAFNLLSEIKEEAVDMKQNFDGTLLEPCLLPARVPNILLNGAFGIAVGMASSIPPHNMSEVIDATIMMIDNPDVELNALLEVIKGPDFPTNANLITNKADIAEIYKTGSGSVKLRAKYVIEDKSTIVLTDLPYQVSGEKMFEKIASMMLGKKLPMIEDLRDESDHKHPTRLVIKTKPSTDHHTLMALLFSETDLEKSYGINLNMIGLNGAPEVKNLQTILTEWLTFRRETYKRKLSYRLRKVDNRIHIVDALLIAYLNLDEVIRIIREDEHPKELLISKFSLTEIQANAILDTKLRQLAKLEEMELHGEKSDLLVKKSKLESILNSSKNLNAVIKYDLTCIKKEFGDERKSMLQEVTGDAVVSFDDLLPSEDISVILSKYGWIRSGKGHSIDGASLSYKNGDEFMSLVKTETNKQILAFDNTGRSYELSTNNLPSARGYGEPISMTIKPPAGASIIAIMEPSVAESKYLMASTLGYGFVMSGEDLATRNTKGKVVLNVGDGQALIPMQLTESHSHVVVALSDTRVLVFEICNLPMLSKGKGNKLMAVKDSSFIAVQAITPLQTVTLNINGSEQVELTPRKLLNLVGNRGSVGKRIGKKADELTSISIV